MTESTARRGAPRRRRSRPSDQPYDGGHVNTSNLTSFNVLPPVEAPTGSEALPDTPSLARVEWEHIQRVLTDCEGNITKAAERLGIHRRSLQRKLAKKPRGD